MQTMKETISESALTPRLFRSTVKQYGTWADFKEAAPDIANHGAQGGFSGFIYYTDTTRFFDRNRRMIEDFIYKQTDNFGVSFVEYIQSIPLLRDYGIDCRSILHGHNMSRYMPENEIDHVKCVFAWIVLEQVAFETVHFQES